MDAAGTIRDLRDVVDAAEKAPGALGRGHGRELWWRGQAVAGWSLTPGVFRNPSLALRESAMALEFRERAETRYGRECPTVDDFPGWLALMQHYRLPTRLLDWTESVMAATFFAVEEEAHHREPGALWALNPSGLNQEHIGLAGLPVSDDKEISPLFAAAFLDPTATGATPIATKVAAVAPREVDIRMLVQLSAFTIHTTTDPIDGMANAPAHVIKYEIPSGDKRRLLHQLRLVGIRRSTLFPDLENLAKDLAGPPTF